MHTIRTTYGKLTRLICFVFALHIFNLSIDPKDAEPSFMPEDLSVNDIESLTEFFAEVVFGFTNAFAEHDEADDNEGNALDFCKIYYSSPDTLPLMNRNFRFSRTKYYIQSAGNFVVLAKEVSSPPPRA